MEKRMRLWIGFLCLIAALLALIVWNVNAGSVHVSPGEILSILLGRGGDNDVIVRSIRLPRSPRLCLRPPLTPPGRPAHPRTAMDF